MAMEFGTNNYQQDAQTQAQAQEQEQASSVKISISSKDQELIEKNPYAKALYDVANEEMQKIVDKMAKAGTAPSSVMIHVSERKGNYNKANDGSQRYNVYATINAPESSKTDMEYLSIDFSETTTEKKFQTANKAAGLKLEGTEITGYKLPNPRIPTKKAKVTIENCYESLKNMADAIDPLMNIRDTLKVKFGIPNVDYEAGGTSQSRDRSFSSSIHVISAIDPTVPENEREYSIIKIKYSVPKDDTNKAPYLNVAVAYLGTVLPKEDWKDYGRYSEMVTVAEEKGRKCTTLGEFMAMAPVTVLYSKSEELFVGEEGENGEMSYGIKDQLSTGSQAAVVYCIGQDWACKDEIYANRDAARETARKNLANGNKPKTQDQPGR